MLQNDESDGYIDVLFERLQNTLFDLRSLFDHIVLQNTQLSPGML